MLPIRNFHNDVFFPSFFNDFFRTNWDATHQHMPAINVLEDEQKYDIEVAAPGMTKEDFKIEVGADNTLSVSFEKRNESNEDYKKHAYIRKEFSYSSFQQAFTLPNDVEKEKISARMDNGVLTISLPKESKAEKKNASQLIEIQ